MKKIVLIITLTLTALLLIGPTSCSASKTNNSTTATTTSGNTINIVNFTFTPGTLTVSVGTTVTWTNNDSTTHRPISNTGVFDSGNLAPKATFSYTFNNAGTFPYHCSIHPYMIGMVIVH